MSQFKEAKKMFLDTIDADDYFDSFGSEQAKEKLQNALKAEDASMVFLLGNPGSGKSFLLNYIFQRDKTKRIIKYIKHPYFDRDKFLKTLLEDTGIGVESVDFETVIQILKYQYKDLEHTIFIDEAQLLSDEQLEMIRILSDMRIFRFVLAMHKKEGLEILSRPHFKTRSIKTIYVHPLENSEIVRYIQSKLLSGSFANISQMLTDKQYKMIAKFTNRNFRTLKKYFYTVMELMDYAIENSLSKYKVVNQPILTMAAIDIGTINVKS